MRTGVGAPPAPGSPPQPGQAPEQGQPDQLDQIVQQILGGEIPGTGYMFPPAPGDRPEPTPTTPEKVRMRMLNALEALTFQLELPFSQVPPVDLGKCILELSQSYLLLDPSVDQEGVPIADRANAEAQAAAKFPPRVQPNAAETAIAEKHKPQSEALRHTRGQTPRPQPRAGG